MAPASLVATHENWYAPAKGTVAGPNLYSLMCQPVFGDVRSRPLPKPLMYSSLNAVSLPSRTADRRNLFARFVGSTAKNVSDCNSGCSVAVARSATGMRNQTQPVGADTEKAWSCDVNRVPEICEPETRSSAGACATPIATDARSTMNSATVFTLI